MTISPLSAGAWLTALNNASARTSGNTTNTTSGQSADQADMSPIARLSSLLQQVQQNRSGRFTSITAQIADKLRTAAGKADANGNTNAAGELNQLADQFQTASDTGKPPAIWQLRHPLAALHHYRETQSQQDPTSQAVLDAVTVAAQGL